MEICEGTPAIICHGEPAGPATTCHPSVQTGGTSCSSWRRWHLECTAQPGATVFSQKGQKRLRNWFQKPNGFQRFLIAPLTSSRQVRRQIREVPLEEVLQAPRQGDSRWSQNCIVWISLAFCRVRSQWSHATCIGQENLVGEFAKARGAGMIRDSALKGWIESW